MIKLSHMGMPGAIILGIALLLSTALRGQRRGENLAFQGITNPNEIGVKALAMGGAYTSRSGDINAMFWNPAGIADLEKIQLFIAANSYERTWQENQVYRPNRFFVTIPFYLEGLYVPDPNNNGRWDYEIADSVTYQVNSPELGEDPFSDEAADWRRSSSSLVFNNIAAALPFNFYGQQFVVSAAYNRDYNLEDFDRNDTFLDPHLGFNEYNNPTRVNGSDTVTVNWYRFLRLREGSIDNINTVLAYNISNKVRIGLGVNFLTGKTDDLQTLDKVGFFDLATENRFRFSYDTLGTRVSGTSDFSAANVDLGAVFSLQKFNIGVKFSLPYTITRDWNYTTEVSTTEEKNASTSSGTDKVKLPARYNLGISFNPVERFIFALDYEYAPYSKSEFQLSDPDPFFQKWVDYQVIRFGAEFKATGFLSLLGGYRSLPVTYVPDGAAFKDRGPASNSYTLGASVKMFQLGRLDLAFEHRTLRYYDSYFSNTNYVTETLDNFYLGYVFSF